MYFSREHVAFIVDEALPQFSVQCKYIAFYVDKSVSSDSFNHFPRKQNVIVVAIIIAILTIVTTNCL